MTLFDPQFQVPTPLACEQFVLSILTPDVVDIDYQVVMKNRHRLRDVFTKHDDWPADSMTLADNLADLTMHQREYQQRQAYAYVIHSPDGVYIGCAYLYPPSVEGYEAELFFWVDLPFVALEEVIQTGLQDWLADVWQVKNLALPGRIQPWSTWRGKLFHAD